MIVQSGNIDSVIKAFRYEVKKSGIVSQLLLKKIAKKRERRKAKQRIALRRRRQAIKRRGLHRENDKG
ncbi:MAG: hypothetical protein ABSH06_25105 [Thermodesulfobacteriota bacterium]|jgi:ribosomal protein S21